ncbi:hypothetical protein [Ureibacillus manganicus]|uniref:BioF2-like acetyltransferase domain-containing protein n=1 Tax=Ureibacillus manganicus DSM 26584 TaxID=1384049 RepID=A0A0A3I678_9BACL|nr:hypothetical protein [Ureibacillus manganicus]KGR78203.1 hypothetical protein CD29_12310 [Ureibacillus manganicus DSM 26584]
MLQINRNFLTIPTNDIYFENKRVKSRYKAKVSCYTHRLKPSRRLQSKRTVHVDLQQDEATFLNNLPNGTKDILFEYNIDKYKIIPIKNPSDEQIRDFQRFYNENINTSIDKINRSKFQSLLLLRDQDALIVTKIENDTNETLGYRVYVADGQNTLLLYVANINLDESNKSNLLLCWENMKMFRNLGFSVYDFGGVDLESSIRCSSYFGGSEVTVFSGYIAKSFVFRMVAKLNQWREKRI